MPGAYPRQPREGSDLPEDPPHLALGVPGQIVSGITRVLTTLLYGVTPPRRLSQCASGHTTPVTAATGDFPPAPYHRSGFPALAPQNRTDS
jgi:hypothetical protein